ncbi:MAG: inositol monophosphatase family protein, partial [Rikenellaceae bacterium]
GFRRIGSAAADLAYIAAGRFDGFAQFNLQAWDVAAGALIAMRAGARVSDYSGGDDYIFGKEIIASNPHIYEDYKMLITSTK